MAVITSVGKSRNIWSALRRIADSCWNGTSNDAEQLPLALSNESILSVNNAGTGTVALIKANASDVVELPTAVLMSGGVNPIAGSRAGGWAGDYQPALATSGTSTQGVANQQFIGPVWVDSNVTLTGAAFLIGTTGGTDRAIVSLYNNAGTLVANSTTASSGTVVGTAANLQSLAFTATYAALGPARYWLSVQLSGTTAFLRTIPAQLSVAFVATKTNSSAVPAATITAPSAFTADIGPIAKLY